MVVNAVVKICSLAKSPSRMSHPLGFIRQMDGHCDGRQNWKQMKKEVQQRWVGLIFHCTTKLSVFALLWLRCVNAQRSTNRTNELQHLHVWTMQQCSFTVQNWQIDWKNDWNLIFASLWSTSYDCCTGIPMIISKTSKMLDCSDGPHCAWHCLDTNCDHRNFIPIIVQWSHRMIRIIRSLDLTSNDLKSLDWHSDKFSTFLRLFHIHTMIW